MTSGKVRWAIVGTGGIGRRTVGDLRLCDTAEVVAVCSRQQGSAEAFARDWSLSLAFHDCAALCASPAVDAVYIGTPHSTHFDYARQALRAGKHVLCEKPLTMTAEEARELGRIAAGAGVFLMEAMWMKFSPAMQRAMSVVAEGVIGEPRFVQAGLGYPVPPNGPKRFWDAALGGGALYDMAVYTITLAQMFLGDPVEITTTGTMRKDGVDLEEAITLRFASGALAQLATSITFMIPPRGWLGGTRGCIDFGEQLFSPGSLRIVTGQPPAPPTVKDEVFAKEGAGYVPMFRAVNQQILAGAKEHPLHPVAATAKVLQIMQTIQQQLAQERDRKKLMKSNKALNVLLLVVLVALSLLQSAFHGFVGWHQAFSTHEELVLHTAWTQHLPAWLGKCVGWAGMFLAAAQLLAMVRPPLARLGAWTCIIFIVLELVSSLTHYLTQDGGSLLQNAVTIAMLALLWWLYATRLHRQVKP